MKHIDEYGSKKTLFYEQVSFYSGVPATFRSSFPKITHVLAGKPPQFRALISRGLSLYATFYLIGRHTDFYRCYFAHVGRQYIFGIYIDRGGR